MNKQWRELASDPRLWTADLKSLPEDALKVLLKSLENGSSYRSLVVEELKARGKLTPIVGPGAVGDNKSAPQIKLGAARGIVKHNGAIYFADAFNHVVRKLTPDGTVETIAGNKGYR